MEVKQLPVGWEEVELKQVGKIVTGNTPSKNNSENYGDITPWIKPPDLDKERYVCESGEYLSSVGEQNARLLPAGSVLVSCIGNIGKAAISGCSLCTNQQINSIVPNENVSGEFVYYSIKKNQKMIESKASRAVVPLLNKTEFSKIKIPLPPLVVQKKIVEVLERAEGLGWWREEADGLMDDYLKSVFSEMFLGEGFEEVELGEVCEINPKKSEISEMDNNIEVSFVPMEDMKEHNIYFDATRIKKIYEVYSGYTYFKEGDILLAKVTPCFENGKSGISRNLKNRIGFGSSEYHVLRPSNKILPELIYCFVSSSGFINSGKKRLTGTGGLRRLPKDYVGKFKIPLPPIALQRKFASIVERVEKIKEDQRKSGKEIDDLFGALMQRAFRGELG